MYDLDVKSPDANNGSICYVLKRYCYKLVTEKVTRIVLMALPRPTKEPRDVRGDVTYTDSAQNRLFSETSLRKAN